MQIHEQIEEWKSEFRKEKFMLFCEKVTNEELLEWLADREVTKKNLIDNMTFCKKCGMPKHPVLGEQCAMEDCLSKTKKPGN